MTNSSDPNAQKRVSVGLDVKRASGTASVEIIDDDDVRETLVDGLFGVAATNGLPRLAFFAERIDAKTQITKRVLVTRLAMTPQTANIMAETLRAVLRKMEEDNLIEKPADVDVK